jgi:hypothetical protein
MFLAKVTQYLRPDGRKVVILTSLEECLKADYDDMLISGCHLEAEVLSTGEVSLTVSDGETDVDIEVVNNDESVVNAINKMLRNRMWDKQHAKGGEGNDY